jgi:hypothetical protein
LLKKTVDKIYINNGNKDVLRLVTNNSCCILDAGCGSGSLEKVLSAAGHTVDGMAISNQEYVIARNYVNNIYLHNLETGLPKKYQATEIRLRNLFACFRAYWLSRKIVDGYLFRFKTRWFFGYCATQYNAL